MEPTRLQVQGDAGYCYPRLQNVGIKYRYNRCHWRQGWCLETIAAAAGGGGGGIAHLLAPSITTGTIALSGCAAGSTETPVGQTSELRGLGAEVEEPAEGMVALART